MNMNTSSRSNGISTGLDCRDLLDRFIMLEAVLEDLLQPLLLQDMTGISGRGSPAGFAMEAAVATDDIIDRYIASHPNEYLDFLRLSPGQIEEYIHQHELALTRINQQQTEFS